jgi:hypothetical protein
LGKATYFQTPGFATGRGSGHKTIKLAIRPLTAVNGGEKQTEPLLRERLLKAM